jgi:hypothetical protein
MPDPTQRQIEDHRRDPSAHPRLTAAVEALSARVDAIVADQGGLEIGREPPKPVAIGASSPGVSDQVAAADHAHELVLPDDVLALTRIGGSGIVMRVGSGEMTARQGPTDAVVVWDDERATYRAGFDATEDLVTVPSLNASDQAGTGDRMVVAQPSGTQRDVPQAVWVDDAQVPGTGLGGTWYGQPDPNQPPTPVVRWVTYAATDGANVVVGFEEEDIFNGDSVGVFVSDDLGDSWTEYAVSSDHYPGDRDDQNPVVYSDYYGRYYSFSINVAAPPSGYEYVIIESSDGIDWYPAPASPTDQTDGNGIQPGNNGYSNGCYSIAIDEDSGRYLAVVQRTGLSQAWLCDDLDVGTTTITTLPGNNWQSVAFGAGLFVVVGTGGVITSPDGITWTARTAPGSLTRIAFGAGRFVVVSTGSSAITSTDGITWTALAVLLPAATSDATLFYGDDDGVWVYFPDNGYNDCYASLDGLTWENRGDIGQMTTAYTIYGVAIGGRIVAAGMSYEFGDLGTAFAWTTAVFDPDTERLFRTQARHHTDRLTVAAHADANADQRAVFADEAGHHDVVADVTWAGDWLRIGSADVAAVSSNGLVARTAPATFAARAVVAGAGVVLTNGDGVAGNPDVSAAPALSYAWMFG